MSECSLNLGKGIKPYRWLRLTLRYIKDSSQISGNVYTAPFSFWNKFDTVSERESYYQIVQQLLSRRVRIEGNPIKVTHKRNCSRHI